MNTSRELRIDCFLLHATVHWQREPHANQPDLVLSEYLILLYMQSFTASVVLSNLSGWTITHGIITMVCICSVNECDVTGTSEVYKMTRGSVVMSLDILLGIT